MVSSKFEFFIENKLDAGKWAYHCRQPINVNHAIVHLVIRNCCTGCSDYPDALINEMNKIVSCARRWKQIKNGVTTTINNKLAIADQSMRKLHFDRALKCFLPLSMAVLKSNPSCWKCSWHSWHSIRSRCAPVSNLKCS